MPQGEFSDPQLEQKRMHRMRAQTVMMPLWELWRSWDSCRLVAGRGISGPQFHRCWQKLLFQRQIISSLANSMDFMFVEGDEPRIPWGCVVEGGWVVLTQKSWATTRHPKQGPEMDFSQASSKLCPVNEMLYCSEEINPLPYLPSVSSIKLLWNGNLEWRASVHPDVPLREFGEFSLSSPEQWLCLWFKLFL